METTNEPTERPVDPKRPYRKPSVTNAPAGAPNEVFGASQCDEGSNCSEYGTPTGG